jgi:hypothetical protein
VYVIGSALWSSCGSDPAVAPGGGGTPDAPGSPDAHDPGAPLTLPLVISDHFVPGGFMGDGQDSPTAITVATSSCKQPRPAGAAGDCYHVTYRPAAKRWGGVYWQYPERNWGTLPGKRVEAGARHVTLYAAAAKEGMVIDFIAGGVGVVPDPPPYHDGFVVKASFRMTTDFMPYQLDLSGDTYDSGVLGAFAWSLAAPTGSNDPMEFDLDAIQWER